MATSLSRRTTLFAGATLAAGLALGACKRGDANAAPAEEAPMVIGPENIVVAKEGVVTSGPTISGTLTPALHATLRAQVSGAVLATSVDVGQTVSRGQSLGRLDAAAITDAVMSARSSVTSAQNTLDLATRDLQRNKTLLDSGAIAPRDYEAAQRTHSSATAALESAKSQLATAQKNLENTRVAAPFRGIVSEKLVNAGDVVQPGTALFTIVDPSSMELTASVPSSQLASVRIGTDVAFSVTGYPGRDFHGRVTRVSPVVDPSTRQVQITIAIPNAGNTLVGGLYADGRLASLRQSGIVIPVAAVDTRLQRPAVVRLRNGKVERADVTLGARDERAETVEITSGVSAGDTLLTAAAQGISPGARVKVQPAPADVGGEGIMQDTPQSMSGPGTGANGSTNGSTSGSAVAGSGAGGAVTPESGVGPAGGTGRNGTRGTSR